MQSLLSVILLFPALGALVLLCVPSVQTRLIRILGLSISCTTFVLSLLLWVFFDHSTAKFQFVDAIDWLPFLNMHFYIGIDGISLFFILLTTFLVPFCLLVSWDSVQKNVKEYFVAFLILESFMLAVFCMLDLLLFYAGFLALILLPGMIWHFGKSSERKRMQAEFDKKEDSVERQLKRDLIERLDKLREEPVLLPSLVRWADQIDEIFAIVDQKILTTKKRPAPQAAKKV